jgi:hypothetical protein
MNSSMGKYVEKQQDVKITEYMNQFYQFLKKNKLYACLQKIDCKCSDSCSCDDNIHRTIHDVKLKMTNDTCAINLKLKGDFQLIKKDYKLKIFSYDDKDNEVSVFNVDYNKLKLYVTGILPNLKFYIKEQIKCTDDTIRIVFDYQSFKKN